MSGPTTVAVVPDPFVVIFAAALAVVESEGAAAALAAAHAAGRGANAATQAAAAAQGRQVQAGEIALAEQRLQQLRVAADLLKLTLPAAPQRPAAGDAVRQAAYLRGLQSLCTKLELLLATEAARRGQDLALDGSIAVPEREPHSAVAAHLLARAAALGPLPAAVQSLAAELAAAQPGQRAELLENELRLRIQQHAQALQHQQVNQATAVVVEQTLADLGYQVEPVAETLFVEGGVVHFRRAGWGEHMVRMRVATDKASAKCNANFNVVRAIDGTEGSANEASVLDHLAEDRWCAEFPALLAALAARGVHLEVTRRLQAGELPVQRVARDQLPRFAEDEEAQAAPCPLARQIK